MTQNYSGASAVIFGAEDDVIDEQFKEISQEKCERLLAFQSSLSDKLSAAGLNFEGKSYPVSIRPFTLKQSTADILARIGENFSDILTAVARLYVDEPEVRKLFPAYKNVESFAIRLPNMLPLIRIFRLDGLFDAAGRYQIIETNTDCPGGVIQNGVAARIWSDVQNPLLDGVANSAFKQPFVSDTDLFIKELIKAHQQRTGEPARRAAVVTFKGRFKNEVTQMVEGFNRLGIPTEIVDAADLKRVANKIVDSLGRIIDIAYNKLDLRDLIDEPQVVDYLEAAAEGEVTFLNPLIGQWILADKAILALLSDPKTLSYFSEEHQNLCRAHIPWTRLVQASQTIDSTGAEIDLLAHISTNRSSLVLKPSNATRGEGVLIGRFTAQHEWDSAIKDVVGRGAPYVVQQYIQGRQITAVHPDSGIVDSMWSGLDTYVYGGKFAGFQARASFDPVMNVGRRGILLPVTFLEK